MLQVGKTPPINLFTCLFAHLQLHSSGPDPMPAPFLSLSCFLLLALLIITSRDCFSVADGSREVCGWGGAAWPQIRPEVMTR